MPWSKVKCWKRKYDTILKSEDERWALGAAMMYYSVQITGEQHKSTSRPLTIILSRQPLQLRF